MELNGGQPGMELRVWVDNVERVVCGVKLSTTCQEIVFALAHATQQTGRFTMVEKWGTNERLLAPTEQPLVTLQRWGDRMNEVEFILRKSATPQSITAQQPYEDLYSTINKKRQNPPAVPAKPKLPTYNHHLQQQQQQLRSNFYVPTQNPLNIYGVRQPSPSIPRRRCPPGYMDYIEAVQQRGQMPQASSSSSIASQASYDGRLQSSMSAMYLMQQQQQQQQQHQQQQQQHMQTSPMMNALNSPGPNPALRYSSTMPSTGVQQHSVNSNTPSMYNNSSASLFHRPMEPHSITNRPRFIEPGLIINRGSAINVRLPPSNQNALNYPINESIAASSYDKQLDSNMSVSQIGQDMLRVIELQKRVLIDQKNELNKLDTESEYWETKNLEQNELISKIEDEIQQLEKLWSENQTHIQKLENQNFEKEISNLKSDQVKLENELEKQKERLHRCETDLVSCKEKIDSLVSELEEKTRDSPNNEDFVTENGHIDFEHENIQLKLATCFECHESLCSGFERPLEASRCGSLCERDQQTGHKL